VQNFLLKFVVSGVNGQPIAGARLRLHNVNYSEKGGDFHRVADNTWGEATVTWNTAPAADAAILAALGAVDPNTWYEVDVTSLITGDGAYSLRVTSTSSNGADYASKEGTPGFAPQLVVYLGALPTLTPTPTRTLTPTPTPTPSQSGLRSPNANAAAAGGDGDGFQTNPGNAHSNDGLFAEDPNSGSGAGTSCTGSDKDKHLFYNYSFTLPGGATVRGIEVRLDARVNNTSSSPKMCVQLSWDGGASWTAAKSTATLTTSEATYTLGGATDTWGRAWSSAEFSNANFRVRVINVASSAVRDFSLDWVAVNVRYQP